MAAATQQLQMFYLASEPDAPAPGSGGFLQRIGEAFVLMRRRQAEREIASFIEQQGGRMTDDLERRIERYFV